MALDYFKLLCVDSRHHFALDIVELDRGDTNNDSYWEHKLSNLQSAVPFSDDLLHE